MGGSFLNNWEGFNKFNEIFNWRKGDSSWGKNCCLEGGLFESGNYDEIHPVYDRNKEQEQSSSYIFSRRMRRASPYRPSTRKVPKAHQLD